MRSASSGGQARTPHLFFEVQDTGIGMSEEAMTRLFTPFGSAQTMAGGTGLELFSLSKRVEALGGHYGVRGRRDGQQGCLFWFSIPYRPDTTHFANGDRVASTVRSMPHSLPLLRNLFRQGLTSVQSSFYSSGSGSGSGSGTNHVSNHSSFNAVQSRPGTGGRFGVVDLSGRSSSAISSHDESQPSNDGVASQLQPQPKAHAHHCNKPHQHEHNHKHSFHSSNRGSSRGSSNSISRSSCSSGKSRETGLLPQHSSSGGLDSSSKASAAQPSVAAVTSSYPSSSEVAPITPTADGAIADTEVAETDASVDAGVATAESALLHGNEGIVGSLRLRTDCDQSWGAAAASAAVGGTVGTVGAAGGDVNVIKESPPQNSRFTAVAAGFGADLEPELESEEPNAVTVPLPTTPSGVFNSNACSSKSSSIGNESNDGRRQQSFFAGGSSSGDQNNQHHQEQQQHQQQPQPPQQVPQFPIGNTPSAPAGSTPMTAAAPAGSGGGPVPPLRILVVDDSPTIVKMTTMVLRRGGHAVDAAENGAVALDMIIARMQQQQGVAGQPAYDVVLMDLNMPVMDGLEATSRLRAMENGVASVPGMSMGASQMAQHRQVIIAFSASSDVATMQAAFNAGVNDFLGKPFSLQAFYQALQRIQQQMQQMQHMPV